MESNLHANIANYFRTGFRLGFFNAAIICSLFFLNFFMQGLFSGFRDEGLGIMFVTSPFVFLLFSVAIVPFFQIAYLKTKFQGILPLVLAKIFILDIIFALIFNIIFYFIILIFYAQVLANILPNKIL